MKKRGLSIRYKALFLFTALPIFALSAYLVLALRVFEQDKISYVFDSTSNMAGSVATQIRFQFNSVLNSCRPIFQNYLTQEKFSQTGREVFENDPGIESVTVFRKDQNGKFLFDSSLEKEGGQSQELVQHIEKTKDELIQLAAKGQRLFRVPFHDDRGLLIEWVSDPQTRRENVFFVVIRLNELAEMFRAETSQQMYLLNLSGAVLMGPDRLVGKAIQTLVSPSFLERTQSQIVSQGAETKMSILGEELLISFSRVGFSDLYVLSTVAKSDALGAVAVLVRKSLVFFGVLVSVSTILSLFASNTLTAGLTSLFVATQKIAKGNFDVKVEASTSDEVGVLAENFNLMADEVARLVAQTAEKARMENELKTARTVQETLFPLTSGSLGSVEIAGHYEPASECGGDWWHYCQIGNRYFFWIGDATGHGVPAALITSAAKSAATIIETLGVGPAKAMELLNRAIYDVSKGRIMMTFFLASYEPDARKLIYVNASHEPPFLIRNSDQELKRQDLSILNEVNNPRLGQARDTAYVEAEALLNSNDTIFFYTDGIQDTQNPDKKEWGERKFINALVSSFKDFPAPTLGVQRFVSTMNSYRQETELIDDVTFFVVQAK